MSKKILKMKIRLLEKDILWLDSVLNFAIGDNKIENLTQTQTQVIFGLSKNLDELREEFSNLDN